GVKWSEYKVSGGRNLEAVSGRYAGDVWTCGWGGTLYHYDGHVWRKDSVPLVVATGRFYVLSAIEPRSAEEVFLIGYVHENEIARTTYYFFRREANQWILEDSAVVGRDKIEIKWGYADLWVSPSGTVYSCGAGVWRWNGAKWELMVDNPSYLSRIAGTDDNNIFVVGHFGTVLHYNGVDWYQFQQFKDPNAVFWGVWTDGKEAIIVGYTADYPQRTIVLHGK
ncbi:MAG: hypothetical protein ACP5ON_11725, partial [Bacteroidota bacterium]